MQARWWSHVGQGQSADDSFVYELQNEDEDEVQSRPCSSQIACVNAQLAAGIFEREASCEREENGKQREDLGDWKGEATDFR